MAGDSRPSHLDSIIGSRLAGMAAWTLAAWTILTTIAAVYAAHCDLPYADEWDTWETWLRHGYSLGWFFSEHADHRIVATRLLFAIGNGAFAGRVWFPQAVSLAVQGWLVFVLWRLAKAGGAGDSEDGRVVGGAIACCLFSGQQLINFTWGFQVQFFLVYAAGATALAALWRASETEHPARRRAWKAGCLLAGAVCSYSMANGVLIWPMLLLAAVKLRVGRPALGVLGACTVLVFAQYLHGWHTSGLDAPSPAWRVVLFALANAGSPSAPLLVRLGAGTATIGFIGMAAGALLMTLVTLQFFRVWAGGSRYSSARIALAHFTVFVAAASFAIAVGRAHLPLAAAFRARYMTPAYILWACLLAVAWPSLCRLGARRARWAVVIALLLGVAWQQLPQIGGARGYGAELTRASVALAVGVNDPAATPILNYTFDYLAPLVEYLRRHRLTVFADEWTGWTGQSLAARFRVAPAGAGCTGGIRDAIPVNDPVRPGWRISGWSGGAQSIAPNRIVLAGADGRILGVAVEYDGQWTGDALPGSPTVTAYAVAPDGKSACAIGTRSLDPR